MGFKPRSDITNQHLIKRKAKTYRSVGTFPTFNEKIVERVKFNTHEAHVHDRSFIFLEWCMYLYQKWQC